MKQKQPQGQKQPQQQQEKPTQDRFLKTVVENRWKVRFKLLEGEEITGTLQGFDNFTITLITEDNRLMLLYKQSIKYIEPILS